MAQNKKNLNEYITTVKSVKPSAEVKFRSTNSEGVVEETVASKTYVAQHADKEFEVADKTPGLSERLKNVAEKNTVKQEELEEVIELEDEESLEESVSAEVTFSDDNPSDESPLTYAPNASTDSKTSVEMSETAMLIKLVSTLIDKIDEMQNFNPVIHVPAPVIHVTLPETKRTVTKAVERDESGWIKSVREHVEEAPEGEPLIEVKSEKPRRKKQKKDSE